MGPDDQSRLGCVRMGAQRLGGRTGDAATGRSGGAMPPRYLDGG